MANSKVAHYVCELQSSSHIGVHFDLIAVTIAKQTHGTHSVHIQYLDASYVTDVGSVCLVFRWPGIFGKIK